MLTATKDLILPTTVTGSWPSPPLVDVCGPGRPFSTRRCSTSSSGAVPRCAFDGHRRPERAGLDIVTNGDYHLDEDFAGGSWHHYPLQRWTGLEHEERLRALRGRLLEFPPGTLMNEIETTWRWPKRGRQGRARPPQSARVRQALAIAQGRAGNQPVVRRIRKCLLDLPR